MKNLSRLLILCAMLMAAGNVSAQKFGIINTSELISMMPEIATVQTKMDAFQKELQNQMETIQVELNTKYEEYQSKMSTLSESVRQLKERELQDIQNRLQSFADGARSDMQRKNQELMAPVIERAENAIKKVGKDGGYWAIFDDAAGPTVYNDETHVINIMPAVKKELGIAESATPKK